MQFYCSTAREFVSTKVAAHFVEMTRDGLRKANRAGRVPALVIGGVRYFHISDLARFKESRERRIARALEGK